MPFKNMIVLFSLYLSSSLALGGEHSGGGFGVVEINLEAINFMEIKLELESRDAKIVSSRLVKDFIPVSMDEKNINLVSLDGQKAVITNVNSVDSESEGSIVIGSDKVTIVLNDSSQK